MFVVITILIHDLSLNLYQE